MVSNKGTEKSRYALSATHDLSVEKARAVRISGVSVEQAKTLNEDQAWLVNQGFDLEQVQRDDIRLAISQNLISRSTAESYLCPWWRGLLIKWTIYIKISCSWCDLLFHGALSSVGPAVILGFGIATPLWVLVGSVFLGPLVWLLFPVLETIFYCLYKLILNLWVYTTLKTRLTMPDPAAAQA